MASSRADRSACGRRVWHFRRYAISAYQRSLNLWSGLDEFSMRSVGLQTLVGRTGLALVAWCRRARVKEVRVPCPHSPSPATAGPRTCVERTGASHNHRRHRTDLVLPVMPSGCGRRRVCATSRRCSSIGAASSATRLCATGGYTSPTAGGTPTGQAAWALCHGLARGQGRRPGNPRHAIERADARLDAMQSEIRDMVAVWRCFRQALAVAKEVPQRVPTDGHRANPRHPRPGRASTSRWQNDDRYSGTIQRSSRPNWPPPDR